MSNSIITVNDDNFEAEVINSSVPVLVDFWAEWCGPCKMMSPILDEVVSNSAYDGKIKIAKLDVEESKQTPAKYGVRGIPTLILFKNGQIEAAKVGPLSKTQLTGFIDENIN